jgi:adenylate kinase family enzyme
MARERKATLHAARRVSVVGNAGSGKTTLALELGRRLGLPVVHLDRHFWRPGWVETPRDEWTGVHRRLIAADDWILDGNYRGTMAERLARSDAAVFLDLPRSICLLSVLGRAIRHRGTPRPDLSPGCVESFPDREFLRFIWRYPSDYRPDVLARLEQFEADGGRVARLRGRRHVREALAAFARDRLANDRV